MKPTIHSFNDISSLKKTASKPLVLFSGGLDGSYLIYRLNQESFSEIYALTIQLDENYDARHIQFIANTFNAIPIHRDLRNEFSKYFVMPAIQAQAKYLNQHPLSASLSRPLIAKTSIEIANDLGCDMIIHSATLSQNSLRRFNGAFHWLNYQGNFGSPFEQEAISREQKKLALPENISALFSRREFSSDTNLWCREFEAENLDNIENLNVSEDLFIWTTYKTDVPSKEITLEFKEGILTKVDNREDSLDNLITYLNYVVGEHGLGRYVSLEELEGGVKFPEIREMPAAFLLLDAYRHLESAILPYNSIKEKMILEQMWVKEAAEGRWFSPLHTASNSFITTLSHHVSGRISYKLFNRNMQLSSVHTKSALYHKDRDLFEKESLTNYFNKSFNF